MASTRQFQPVSHSRVLEVNLQRTNPGGFKVPVISQRTSLEENQISRRKVTWSSMFVGKLGLL